MKVVYRHNFGNDTFGEVRENAYGHFQCYETPLYGGEFQKVGDVFLFEFEAIQYLKSLT